MVWSENSFVRQTFMAVLGRRRKCPSRRARGFTLIEAAMTTVIIGVGFVAMLQLLAAGTINNARGAETTSGVNLAKNVREMLLKERFADLRGLYHGAVFSPPLDSRGVEVPDFDGWSQTISVQPVDPDMLTLDVSSLTPPQALRITVTVRRGQRSVCSMSWYSFNAAP